MVWTAKSQASKLPPATNSVEIDSLSGAVLQNKKAIKQETGKTKMDAITTSIATSFRNSLVKRRDRAL